VRGGDQNQSGMFSYLSPDERVRKEHPLRTIRVMVDRALREMSPVFDEMYSEIGRPSIAPEKLLRAQLLQMLYSVRSERLLMEEIDDSVLFRWFVGMNMDEPVWDPTVFTKNRDRLLEHEVAKVFFAQVWKQAEQANLTSDEHFTVDGTLLEACASLKSFQKKGMAKHDEPDDPGNPTVNFHGETRTNATHVSTTDPDARLYKKAVGREAKLGYLAHLLTENRHGLIVDTAVTAASGTAERDAAIVMLGELPLTTRRLTVAADKAYDIRAWVAAVRRMGITPHVAQNAFGYGGSAIDGRTTRHAGYQVSHRKRKLIEQAFGWLKTVALLRKLRHRGGRLVDWIFTFGAAAYNLVRWRNLIAQRA